MLKNYVKKLIFGTPLEIYYGFLIKLLIHLRLRKKDEWTFRGERDEINTEALIRNSLNEASNCVDIGANVGSFLSRFVQLSPKGKHYAFEPLPHLAAQLNKDFPDVEVFDCALSDITGTATFYHSKENEGWSGLQKQNYPMNTVPIEIRVKLKRLNDIIPKDVHIDFIKIDVEGAELEVLRGAESIIRRCHPIIYFEHAKIHNENYKTTPDAVYNFLVEKCGYKIWNLQLSKVFTRKEFIDIYESSFISNYNRNAQTNFVAKLH